MERRPGDVSLPLTGLAPPLGNGVDALLESMRDRGYASATLRVYGRVIGHFAQWAVTARHPMDGSETTAREFVDVHLPACRCRPPVRRTRHGVPTVLRQLLGTLRAQGLVRLPMGHRPTATAVEVERFETYLREVCGAGAATRRYRTRYVREFLAHVFGGRPIVFERLEPSTLVRFVAARAQGCAPGTGRVIASALRSYLRFRRLGGAPQATQLLAAVPHIAGWRLATLPRVLTDAQLRAVLAAFDRTIPTGRRDYAMVLCMATLGLRASEVAGLRLHDIDWRAGTLCVAGDKTHRARLLPLPASVGRALAGYVRRGRPPTTTAQLFVRHTPPRGAVLEAAIVRNATRAAYARAGLPPRYTRDAPAPPHRGDAPRLRRDVPQGDR